MTANYRDVETTSEYDLGECFTCNQIDLTVHLDVTIDTDSEDRPRYEWTVHSFTVQGDKWSRETSWTKRDFTVDKTNHPALFAVLTAGLDEDHIRDVLHQQDIDNF